MNESFDKLDNEFNVPTTPSEEITLVKQQTKELVEKSSRVRTLEDKVYLQEETKNLIENSKRVLDVMQKDIKIGTPPRNAEVYAKLLSSTIECIRELRELNKTVADMEMFDDSSNDNTSKPQASINIKMTAKELMTMMKEARETSQLKAVSTEFSVEGEPKNGWWYLYRNRKKNTC